MNITEKDEEISNECICEKLYNCCDCGGTDCGCAYCWSCNACDNCLDDREEKS